MKIDAQKFEALITKSGLKAEQSKSRTNVYGAKGRVVGVGAGETTKTLGEWSVWLVGFECEHGRGDIGARKTGTVTQYMRFDGTEDEVLARFEALLAHLATLPAVEAPAKPERAKKADAPKGMTGAIPKAQSKSDRKALIEKTAREKGVKVSAKTVAEFESSSSNGVSAQ